eukprot:1969446-Rhodomonas_salina.3
MSNWWCLYQSHDGNDRIDDHDDVRESIIVMSISHHCSIDAVKSSTPSLSSDAHLTLDAMYVGRDPLWWSYWQTLANATSRPLSSRYPTLPSINPT